MVRNFTSDCKQYLLNLVSEENNEQIGSVSENFGDLLSTTASSLGFTTLEGYANDMDGYFTGVVDKNATTSTDILNIFGNVYQADSVCYGKISALKGVLDTYKNSLDLLAEAIDPANDKFNVPDLGSVSAKIDINKLVGAKLMVQGTSGLTDEDISNMSPDELQRLIDTTISNYLLTHSVKIGEKVEIPITANVKVFYEVKVEGEANKNGYVDIEGTIKDQEAKLKNISVKLPISDAVKIEAGSDGKGSISVEADGKKWKTSVGADGSLGTSASVKDGNDTYTTSFSTKGFSTTISGSVATKVGSVTVTSTAGIEINNQWKTPKYAPAPAYAYSGAPDPDKQPQGATSTAPNGQVVTSNTTGSSGWNINPPVINPPSGKDAGALVGGGIAIGAICIIGGVALCCTGGGAAAGATCIVIGVGLVGGSSIYGQAIKKPNGGQQQTIQA